MALPRRFVTNIRLKNYVIASWCLSQFVFILRNQTATLVVSRAANAIALRSSWPANWTFPRNITRLLENGTRGRMVSYNEVKAANAALSTKHEHLTAVFAGATSGIGLATLKSFAKHVPKPTAIIVGRNRARFEPELQNLQSINPNGTYTFLESEISLIKNIDTVCDQVKSQLSSTTSSNKSLDLVFLSQGFLRLDGGRQNNAEGLDSSIALRYYTRVRMVENLLPLMSPNARIVSVLAGGKEGKIFTDDMDLQRNFSIMNAMGHFSALHSLSFDALAEQNPGKSFVHVFPGFVNTGALGKYNSGIVGTLMWLVETLSDVLGFSIKVEESGERTLYYGTCEEFRAEERRGRAWVLDWDGRVVENKALKGYRMDDSTKDKVMEHNTRTFERITS